MSRRSFIVLIYLIAIPASSVLIASPFIIKNFYSNIHAHIADTLVDCLQENMCECVEKYFHEESFEKSIEDGLKCFLGGNSRELAHFQSCSRDWIYLTFQYLIKKGSDRKSFRFLDLVEEGDRSVIVLKAVHKGQEAVLRLIFIKDKKNLVEKVAYLEGICLFLNQIDTSDLEKFICQKGSCSEDPE